MDIESKLTEAEEQVAKNCQAGEFVFVEPELKPMLWYLIRYSASVNTKTLPRLKELLRNVASMKKSTSLGCEFYHRLEHSSFPFAQEVLREAVETEPYSNCNDAALKSYIAVALRNVNISGDIADCLLRHIPDSHLIEYINTIRAVGDSRPSIQIDIPEELKSTLIFAASRDCFEETRGKALCALVYFGINEITPALKNTLQKYAQQTDKPWYGLLVNITTTATALEYLTGDKQYRQLVDFVRSEMKILRDVLYSEYTPTIEFIQILNGKIREF